MSAVAQFKDPSQLIKDYAQERLKFVEGLKTFSIFGEGWESRIEFVRDKALSMV
jgi:lysozyme family protein